VKLAICSGYFNPMHIGHLDYLQSAKDLAEKLFVIVNNDYQVSIKGSTPFMSEVDRVRIISTLECVDKVVLSKDLDDTVLKTLKSILIQHQACGRNSFIFCNGGDRGSENTAEEYFCDNNNYYLTSVYNVGGNKKESSSTLINNAAKNNIRLNDEFKKFDKTLKRYDL